VNRSNQVAYLLVEYMDISNYHKLRRTCVLLRDDTRIRDIVPHLEGMQFHRMQNGIIYVHATIRFVSNGRAI